MKGKKKKGRKIRIALKDCVYCLEGDSRSRVDMENNKELFKQNLKKQGGGNLHKKVWRGFSMTSLVFGLRGSKYQRKSSKTIRVREERKKRDDVRQKELPQTTKGGEGV